MAIGTVDAGITYSGMGKFLPLLKSVDEQSKVWQKVKLDRHKLSHTVSDAIGPHFHEAHLRAARNAFGFSLAFDSATSKREGLTKNLDLHLTYWDSDKEQIVDRLLEIISVTTETADILLTRISDCFEEKGLKASTDFDH